MEIEGIAVSDGLALGRVRFFGQTRVDPTVWVRGDEEAEVKAVRDAFAFVAKDLDDAAARSGGEVAEIMEAEALIAQDPVLLDRVLSLLSAGDSAPRAVERAGKELTESIAGNANSYIAERADDVAAVTARVLSVLLGQEAASDRGRGRGARDRTILLASELTPSDTALLDLSTVVGIVTESGSRTSHASIIARSLAIPAIVAARGDLRAIVADGDFALIDGEAGRLVIGDDAIRVANEVLRPSERSAAGAEEGQPSVPVGAAAGLLTRDGAHVELAGNAANASEVAKAMDSGAESVGLYRTELAFLESDKAPTGETLDRLYRSAAEACRPDGKLVIRTFDFGADKYPAFMTVSKEANPALGVRGIRLARAHEDLLRIQLASISHITERTRVCVMAPMISTPGEARWFAELAREILGDEIGVGVMIEVPSAVFSIEEIARYVDFVSIGTNDLTQYLFAADRLESGVAHLQDPFAPPVLRAVDVVVQAVHGHGGWVGICGEAAGFPDWAVLATGLGVDELSMSASAMSAVKKRLSLVSSVECVGMAHNALSLPDAASVRSAVENRA